jgi:dTDP-3-amino-3,4,6-trideoxy-alpha-D-glucose transaminase
VIPLNDFGRQWADVGEEVVAAVREVGASGWYVLGEEVRRFEEALAGTFGRRHCVGVACGLDALEIGLRSLGCRPGDQVLTTPLSAFATTLAIVRAQAVPVFVDVDATGQIDLEKCARLLRDRPEIRYLVPVHLYGQPLDPGALTQLRDRLGCRIVEDCAQSILARRGDRPTGDAGQVAATSFYPTKNLGALGDGGALLTDDADLARRARELRDYGQAGKYHHVCLGLNSRLDELHAAVLRRVLLPRLEGWTQRRRAVARRYRTEIAHPRLRIPEIPDGAEECAHLFPVLVDRGGKASFRAFLEQRGIATAEHYPVPIPDQPALQGVPFEAPFGLTRVRAVCAAEVSLPLHAYLSDDEVGCVVAAANAWGE